MNTVSPELAARLQAGLKQREAQLRAALAGDFAQARADDAATQVTDFKELAEESALVAVHDMQQAQLAQELEATGAALRRLAAGTYSQCAACGEPIEPARLLAMPTALRCRDCQARGEDAA